jgi:hypothetical protein
MRRVTAYLVVALLLAVTAGTACSPADPREKVLDRRALWKVDLLSWAMGDDGSMTIGARISGPATRKLDRLTVRVEMQDAEGRPVDHEWKTLDLSGIKRGGPKDIVIMLAPRAVSVEGIAINLVPNPDPEESGHIAELDL